MYPLCPNKVESEENLWGQVVRPKPKLGAMFTLWQAAQNPQRAHKPLKNSTAKLMLQKKKCGCLRYVEDKLLQWFTDVSLSGESHLIYAFILKDRSSYELNHYTILYIVKDYLEIQSRLHWYLLSIVVYLGVMHINSFISNPIEEVSVLKDKRTTSLTFPVLCLEKKDVPLSIGRDSKVCLWRWTWISWLYRLIVCQHIINIMQTACKKAIAHTFTAGRNASHLASGKSIIFIISLVTSSMTYDSGTGEYMGWWWQLRRGVKVAAPPAVLWYHPYLLPGGRP